MTQPQKQPQFQPPAHKPWLEGAKTIGLSLILAFGMRQFVAEGRYIPSGSMEPTLAIDDRLVIDKLSYRFNSPQRGDIVVFTPPDSAAVCNGQPPKPNEAYIKRLIGTPGDRVEIKQGQAFVNDQPIAENYTKAASDYDYGPITVPPASYFVLGDNRNQSCDSHYWGFVPAKNIIGKAAVRYWPPNHMGNIDVKSAQSQQHP